MWKQSLLKFARNEYAKREEVDGSVASISPTPNDLMRQVLQDTIFARLVSNDSDILMFVDLGCGDGRWLEHILNHKFNYNCVCFGIEIDNDRIELAKNRCSYAVAVSPTVASTPKLKIFEIIKGDIRHYPLHLMNVIIVYLSIKGNELIKEKIMECSKGSLIIAVGFAIKESSELVLYKQYVSSNGLKLYIYCIV